MAGMDKMVRRFDLGHWADSISEQFDAIAVGTRLPEASGAA